jgi:DNA-binding IclR family transcriptional regulator
MVQHEIIIALKDNQGQKFTVAEISHHLGYPKNTVSRSVTKLIKCGMVKAGDKIEEYAFRVRGTTYHYKKRIRRVWL